MFHCIPFIVGAAAGTAVTFMSADRRTRETIKDSAEALVDGARRGLKSAAQAVMIARWDRVGEDNLAPDRSPTDR
jgi:hypothetical protein